MGKDQDDKPEAKMKYIFQKAFSTKKSCVIVIKIYGCVVSSFRGSPHGARIF